MPFRDARMPSSSTAGDPVAANELPGVEEDVELGPVEVGGQLSHPLGVFMAVGDKDVEARIIPHA
jgi:hypothetical protein